MTLSAVVFAPHPPLLLRANAGLVDVGAPLRRECLGALTAAADRGADRVVLLTGRDEPSGERPRSTAAPLGVRVGRELLSLAGIGAPIEVVTVGRAADGPAVETAAAGVRERCAGSDRVLLLVLGDGSARRDTDSPGLPDERALAYDAALLAALARADAPALARLDADGRDEELLIAGRAALQVAGRVVAGAAPDLVPTPCGAAFVDGFGVAYAVGWWSCVPGSHAVAQPGRPGADVEAVGGASREGRGCGGGPEGWVP